MNNKFLLSFIALIGLFFCSTLWGETDNPWDNVLSFKENQNAEPLSNFNSVETGGNQIASPQTFCATNPFATACHPTCDKGPFPGGYLWRYQNPRDGCPDTVYPFRVEAISISLTNCGLKPCTLSLEGGIYRIAGRDTCPDGKICRTPGALICPSQQKTVILSPVIQCTTVFLRLLDTTCCVYTSYFAGVKLQPPAGCFVNPCLDNSSDTCRGSWYWDGRGPDTLNMLCDLGFPQNICINSYGYVRDQNSCPRLRVNRGIRNITISPGPQIDQAQVMIDWYAQILPPNPNKPPNPNIDASSRLEIMWPGMSPIMLERPLLFHPPNLNLSGQTALGECLGSKLPCNGVCSYKWVGSPGSLICVFPGLFFGDSCACEQILIDTVVIHLTNSTLGNLMLDVMHWQNYCLLCGEGCSAFPESRCFSSCCCLVCGDPEPYMPDEDYMQDDTMTVPLCVYKPGDVNRDGMHNLTDIIGEVNIVFKGAPKPPLTCLTDPNADMKTNLSDIIYDVNYVYRGGMKPKPSGVCCK